MVFVLQGAASTHMLYIDYKMPTSMKLGMETDLNVPAVVFMVYVSLRGFPSAFYLVISEGFIQFTV
jgi:hypothetical protein